MPAITVEEARQHVRVLDESENGWIETNLKGAIEWVEGLTGHIFEERTVTESFSGFSRIRLNSYPIKDLIEVSYVAANYLDDSIDPDDLRLIGGGLGEPRPGRLARLDRSAWPSVCDAGVVTIKLTAGYPTPAEIPGPLKQAALLYLAGLYNDRETGGLAGEVEKAATRLCAPFASVL